MKNSKIFNLMVASSIFACSSAFAQVHTLGADGPAAISFIAGVFSDNIDANDIKCSLGLDVIKKQILLKNVKLTNSTKNKNVKSFLKQIGAEGSLVDFFDQASIEAYRIFCDNSDDGKDDGEDLPDSE